MVESVLLTCKSPPGSANGAPRACARDEEAPGASFGEVYQAKKKRIIAEEAESAQKTAQNAAAPCPEPPPCPDQPPKPVEPAPPAVIPAGAEIGRGVMRASSPLEMPVLAQKQGQVPPVTLPAGAAPQQTGNALAETAAVLAQAAGDEAPQAPAQNAGQAQASAPVGTPAGAAASTPVVQLENDQSFADLLAAAAPETAEPVQAAPVQTAAKPPAVAKAETAEKAVQPAQAAASGVQAEGEGADARGVNQSAKPAGDFQAVISHVQNQPGVRDVNLRQPIEQVDVSQQILRYVEMAVQHGRSAVRVQLNPADLGAIDIRLVTSAQGVSVTFLAEQASTGRLLEAQMNQLRQSLNDAGVQLTNLNIGQHGQPAQQQGAFEQRPHTSTRRTIHNVVQNGPDAERDVRSRSIGGIDYRA